MKFNILGALVLGVAGLGMAASITSLVQLTDQSGGVFTQLQHDQINANATTANTNFAILANGSALSALTSAPTPSTAGGIALGSAALPFSGIYLGAAATNNAQVTGTFTGARTVTLPDASITVPGTVVQGCGTTTTCSATNNSATSKMVYGSVALSAGTATVTGISPTFTSSSSFVCTATDVTAANATKVVNASSSSITITGTSTDTVNYVCAGN